jgi:hypothetical protein
MMETKTNLYTSVIVRYMDFRPMLLRMYFTHARRRVIRVQIQGSFKPSHIYCTLRLSGEQTTFLTLTILKLYCHNNATQSP